MKIVLATKNPPLYENTLDRKSYITIKDKNQIHDNVREMKENQNEYFSKYFNIDESQISNKFNLNINDLYTRTSYVELKNYPTDMYNNNFEFWNNISYAKLIYDNGFIEYCYISARRCDNLAINKWYFTFTVDVWNTYWIDTYHQFKLIKNFSILVLRGHFDRFDYNENNKILNFKFLSSQNNAFWNKEQFETTISSKIVISNGTTNTPYSEPYKNGLFDTSIIKYSEYLNELYGLERLLDPFLDSSGLGYPLAFINHNDKDIGIPWDKVTSLYGVANTYWWVPIINNGILDSNFRIDTRNPWFINAFDSTKSTKWEGNLKKNIINLPALASYIITPKPNFSMLARKFREENSYLYNDVCYPIRYRDDFIKNNNQIIGSSVSTDTVQISVGDSKTLVTEVYYNNKNLFDTRFNDRIPFEDNQRRTDFTNTLCDERINLKDNNVFDNLAKYIDLSTVPCITPTILENEPKLYDEDIFNVEYSRYGQGSISISPKWYFFDESKKFEDILKWKSIFLLGYQFIQPQICILTTGVVSGLYRYANKDGSKNLNTQYSPQQQTVTDAEKQFLITNRSQLNTGLNNTQRNLDYDLFTQQTSFGLGMQPFAMVNALINPISIYNSVRGFGQNRLQSQNAQDMYNAKLNDLANTPNATSDKSSESTYKIINTYKGQYKINWINNIDKQKILSFHQQQGYFLNKIINVGYGSSDNLTTLATRMYYNFWQIADFKLLIQTSNIASEYQEYFNNLFSIKGVTLWHTYITPNGIIYDTVGDYTRENWEQSLLQYLLFSDSTKLFSSKNDIIGLPITTNLTIKNLSSSKDDLIIRRVI